MNDPRNQAEFEEGMCSQDVERFRSQNGLPMNGVYDDEDDEVEGDGVSCYY
jgi:hypothetical protein